MNARKLKKTDLFFFEKKFSNFSIQKMVETIFFLPDKVLDCVKPTTYVVAGMDLTSGPNVQNKTLNLNLL